LKSSAAFDEPRTSRSGCPVQPRSHPRNGLILAHHASSRLDFRYHAPPDNKRARERGIGEVDRQGIIQHAARPRRCYGPASRSAILVEPCGYLLVSLAKTVWWTRDPNSDGEASLRRRDHVARIAWHLCSSFLSVTG